MKRTTLVAAAFTCSTALAVAAPDTTGNASDAQPSLSGPKTAANTRRATAIKIEVFERGTAATSVILPLWLAKSASKMLPKQAEGIDIDQIIALVENAPENGILPEVNDQKTASRVSSPSSASNRAGVPRCAGTLAGRRDSPPNWGYIPGAWHAT